MNTFLARWALAIDKRRSRRQFESSRPISPDVMKNLRYVCAIFKPYSSARAEMVLDSPDKVFKGALGPYGKVRGALAYIAFIGNMNSLHVQEEVGYTGEGIILEATSLGLDTCWVGGFFKRNVADTQTEVQSPERVLAVTPVGYARGSQSVQEKVMTGFGKTHQRNSLSSMVSGLGESEWPDWARASLEAARLAPSAINRQPWGFHVEPNAITISVRSGGPDFNISRRLDCGIAMMHIEIAALSCGMEGEWEFLDDPQVARFRVKAGI
ncbi:MAG: nitroreductase family protein [Dehalococcoidia bacterium]|nr:nitroreductase family protein [Dehalococcoidia bacterium]